MGKWIRLPAMLKLLWGLGHSMTRSERRLLIDTSILGLALTFLVTFLDFAGMLSAPERFFSHRFNRSHASSWSLQRSGLRISSIM